MDTPFPIRALLVDDDPTMLALLTALLKARGYAVAQAPDGQAALEKLALEPFDLVITDRVMPRMDGLDLVRALRARGDPVPVYCLMLTAASEREQLAAALDAGVDDFLAKPLHVAELGARLRVAERVLALQAELAACKLRLPGQPAQ